MTEGLSLEVRRTIKASAERLFEAWTTPELLKKWWGPQHVTCTEAQVDLKVGGSYRLANQLPNGSVLYIEGEFERIEPPKELVYSWHLRPKDGERDKTQAQRVTVRFEPHSEGTEVFVFHERIDTEAAKDEHGRGWKGCLDGLRGLFAEASG